MKTVSSARLQLYDNQDWPIFWVLSKPSLANLDHLAAQRCGAAPERLRRRGFWSDTVERNDDKNPVDALNAECGTMASTNKHLKGGSMQGSKKPRPVIKKITVEFEDKRPALVLEGKDLGKSVGMCWGKLDETKETLTSSYLRKKGDKESIAKADALTELWENGDPKKETLPVIMVKEPGCCSTPLY
ncbi:MAG: hypothetical protein Q8O19_00220 [Rectinemataceae bacterium]|nr:hypothetical protein [Rectinemataceae bacterium]